MEIYSDRWPFQSHSGCSLAREMDFHSVTSCLQSDSILYQINAPNHIYHLRFRADIAFLSQKQRGKMSL